MIELKIENGDVLLAQPFSLDTNFRRTAVMLTDHHDDGTVGFIVNRPLDVQVNELISGLHDFKSQVYFGGPVATDSIHYIHNVGDLLDDSIKIKHGIYWGGDFEKLKFLIDTKLIQPTNIRFYVGYSGWSSGQLAEELSHGSWVVADIDTNHLFKSSAADLWRTIMNEKGNTYSVIAQVSDDINWN